VVSDEDGAFERLADEVGLLLLELVVGGRGRCRQLVLSLLARLKIDNGTRYTLRMAVTRRGIDPPTVPRPSRSLRRVLVTIDDLDALLSLLVRLERDISTRDNEVLKSSLSMEFDGGTFTEPGDLRKMSDEELKRIVVKSRSVEVVLAPERAVAIGDPATTEQVYQSWARARQTRVRPKKLPRHRWATPTIFALIGVMFFYVGLAHGNPDSIVSYFPAFLSFALIVGPFLAMRSLPYDFATVRAVSLDEFRKDRDTSARHWMMAAIALAGVVVALASTLATVLLRK
jgi:hypothetical protein